MSECARCGKIRADLREGVCAECRRPSLWAIVQGGAGLVAALGCIAVVVFVGFLGVAFVGGLIKWAASDEPAAEAPVAPTVSKQEVRVTVDELRDLFGENQIAGAEYLKSHTALVAGQVIRVREAFGTGIVQLKSPRGDEPFEIGFTEAGTRELAQLRSGDIIVARCPTVLEAIGQIIPACDRVEVEK